MTAADIMYHASYEVFQPGQSVIPGVRVTARGPRDLCYPPAERWRTRRVWLAQDAGNAGAWYGHDDPDVRVYEVSPIGARAHRPGRFDRIDADHEQDQFVAKGAIIRREVPKAEWNDFYRREGVTHDSGPELRG